MAILMLLDEPLILIEKIKCISDTGNVPLKAPDLRLLCF
jgi:hypothetical protein